MTCSKWLQGLCCWCVVLCLTCTAGGGAYRFTALADTRGPFEVLGFPTISDLGTVGFRVRVFDAGGEGVFTADEQGIALLADDSGPLDTFIGEPVINGQGTAVYLAIPDHGSGSILATVDRNGQTNEVTVNTGQPFLSTSSSGFPVINDAGVIAFRGRTTNDRGIYTIDSPTTGSTATTVIDDSGAFGTQVVINSAFHSINNDAAVAFVAEIDGVQGVYKGDGSGGGGPIVTIADDSGAQPQFRYFDDRAMINDHGVVAFGGQPVNGPFGLFTGDGQTITPIVDRSGPFDSISVWSINNAATIAFLARLDTGEQGIFTGTDPQADKVIAVGDILDGLEVHSLRFSPWALNNNEQLVFVASLNDGQYLHDVIYRADLIVPEPATWFIFTTTLALRSLTRRRTRRHLCAR